MPAKPVFDKHGKVLRKRQEDGKTPQKSAGERETPQLSGQLDAEAVTQLQQTVGNSAVQRLIAQRESTGPGVVDEETADTIHRQRGSGQRLDKKMADKAGTVMDQDVSDVTIHTDSQADKVSRKLGAKAFTTGKDVFFRDGAYDPHSQDGQKLIGHELTHVVQQGQNRVPTVQGKVTVNDPNDPFEAEADQVADKVAGHSETAADVQRQPEEEELQMQAESDEEELTQLQPEEEEEVQMKRDNR